MARMTDLADSAKRQRSIMVAVLIVMLVFAGRLVYVQGIAGPALAQDALDMRLRSPETIYAPRGEILDSSGTVLATTVETYDIRANLNQIPDYRLKDPDDGAVVGYGALAAADQLIKVLGVPDGEDPEDYRAEFAASLVGTNGYHLIASDVSPKLWEEVRDLRIDGIYAETQHKREYPNNTLAGSMIGFVDAAGNGGAGLEYRLEEHLQGKDGERSAERGAGGQVIPTGQQEITPAIPGCDVHLTIDSDLQWHAQEVVDEAVSTYGAEWGAALVIENETGKILSLADSGAGDPNKAGKEGADAWRLNSVQGVYDPGSTGKVLTVLSALEEGVVTPTTPIEDPYAMTMPNGQKFSDHTEHPDQTLTVAGVLAESANTGTINIGKLLDDDTRYSYMQKMGWGEKTGIELPNESAGLLRPPEEWDGRTKYATMFGQGLGVTLAQNTSVFAMIGNDGTYLPPRLIDRMECDGETIATEPDPVDVASKESSREMIRMLESVVTSDSGTGHNAAVEGYRVAGKTGTAQIPDASGKLNDNAASFVGMVPAEDPELTIGVVIYRPSSGFYGGTVAAPVFADIASFALPKLGILPSTEEANPYPLKVE